MKFPPDTSENTVYSNSDAANLIEVSFEKNSRRLYLLALKVTKSPQQSQDILQNVFIKAWEHRFDLAGVANMDAWLHRVTMNELIDFLRKTAADKRLQEKLWKKLRYSHNWVEEELQAKETDLRIHRAVSELPAQRKLVYRLNREAGLDYRQIAEKLSISTHTVKNQIHLALRSISQFLTGLLIILLACQ